MLNILACTDGSAYASSIYEHAAWAAQRMNTGVQVLHVIEHHREQSRTKDLSGAIGFDSSTEVTEELAKLEEAEGREALLKGKAILEEARQQLTEVGVGVVEMTHRHGTLVGTLEELEPRAELVVVGKRGEHGGGTSSPLGENLEQLVRISVKPVLVASLAFKPIQRFLLAFDNSASAQRAVAYATASPLLKGLPCHLMMVGKADLAPQKALNETREQLARAGYHVTAELKPGNAARVIADEVGRAGVDLLVMGAYGHSPIREFLVGSTTTKLVRGCAVPVLMFR